MTQNGKKMNKEEQMKCQPTKYRQIRNTCFEAEEGFSRCKDKCMYMEECDDCGGQLDINTEIQIMVEGQIDKNKVYIFNDKDKEKTICGYCYDDYSYTNNGGWYNMDCFFREYKDGDEYPFPYPSRFPSDTTDIKELK